MPREGSVWRPSGITEAIQNVLMIFCANSVRQIESSTIIALCSDYKDYRVRDIIAYKLQTGHLERVRRGTYKILNPNIVVRRPRGEVAAAVWQALVSLGDYAPLDQIFQLARKFSRGKVRNQKSVSAALTIWKESLDRKGKRGHSLYKILPGITSRPPLQH